MGGSICPVELLLETGKKLFFKIENEKILPDYLNTNRKKYQDWIAE